MSYSKFRRTWLLAFVIVLFVEANGRAADTASLIVLPFENTSGPLEYNWIGESFAQSLSTLMQIPGIDTVDADERALMMERLGFPRTAILSRASAIRLAEQSKVDLLLVGSYSISGSGQSVSIAVSARLIDVKGAALIGTETQKGGPVADLQRLQGELAWTCLYQYNPALALSRGQVIERATAIPSRAFESFVKGMLTPEPQDRARFLQRALKDAGGKYPQAVFELGRTAYLDGDYNEAIKWLSQVADKDARSDEADFYLGVSLQRTGQYGESMKLFQQLLSRIPLYEVYNNAGVLNFEQNKPAESINLLKTAAENALRDVDAQFNLGYVAWRNGEWGLAAEQMRKAVARRAGDGEAHYVLYKALAAMGRSAEAQEAAENAKKLLPRFAEWETTGRIPDLLRLKSQFNKASYYQLTRRVADLRKSQAQSAEVEDLLARARGNYIAGHDAEALDQTGALLKIAPDNPEAHLLAGRIYERAGDYQNAMNSLKAAIFWNDRLVAAHVLLGKIYLLQKNCESAKASLRKALEADPQHVEALALQRTWQASCGNEQ